MERSTRAIVDLGAVSHNVAAIREKVGPGRGLMAVVKADGYGHGAVRVARVALASGADSLAVAIPEEGRELREAGIEVPILVLGLIQPDEAYKVVESRLEQTVSSMELLRALDQEAQEASVRVRVHVKVDTGMSRIGVQPEDAVAFVQAARRLENLTLYGLYSHFASADERDKSFSLQQLNRFNSVVEKLAEAGLHIPKKHMANSAAILDIPESYYDVVRPGIIIYGAYPSGEVQRSIDLKPAMTLKTRITELKVVPPGIAVSYGRTYTTGRQATVATLPIGYADGYNRRLSNRAEVWVNGSRAPVIGRVCMDMCMIDVSGVGEVWPGDDVVLFGDDIPVEEVAEIIGTINYEVLCAVSKRVPRVYVGGTEETGA